MLTITYSFDEGCTNPMTSGKTIKRAYQMRGVIRVEEDLRVILIMQR